MKKENIPVILVVDDEEHMINSIERILRGRYRVISSQSAGEAMIKIKSNKIDIIITDLAMPEMNGIELIRNIRRLDSDIGIIMITGYGTVDTYIEATDLGAFEYFNKPFDNDFLLSAVEKLLLGKVKQ